MDGNTRKLKITIRTIISIVLLLVVVGLTTLISLVPNFGLDFSQIKFDTWLGDTGISVSLALVGMFVGESMIIGFLQNRADGTYKLTLNEYRTARDAIANESCYFQQYLDKEAEASLLKQKKRYLTKYRIKRVNALLKLTPKDVVLLGNEPVEIEIDGKIENFPAYTAKEIEKISIVCDETFKFRFPSKDFYLTENSLSRSVDEYEEAIQLINARKSSITISRAFKIVSVIFISAFWASLTVTDFVQGDQITPWINLAKRIASLLGGVWAGGLNDFIANNIDIKILNNKINKLREYKIVIESGKQKFDITDEEYEAKKEYEMYRSVDTQEGGGDNE